MWSHRYVPLWMSVESVVDSIRCPNEIQNCSSKAALLEGVGLRYWISVYMLEDSGSMPNVK